MRPSVITATESAGSSPLERSTVSTVSMPSPENPTGRRTWRHWTSARFCVALRPARLIWYVGSQLATRDEATTARLRLPAAASSSLVLPLGCVNGSWFGTCAVTTILTLAPTSRAETYAPSRVSVRTTRRACGFETSISVRTDSAGWNGIIRAAIAGIGSAQ